MVKERPLVHADRFAIQVPSVVVSYGEPEFIERFTGLSESGACTGRYRRAYRLMQLLGGQSWPHLEHRLGNHRIQTLLLREQRPDCAERGARTKLATEYTRSQPHARRHLSEVGFSKS